MDGCLEEMVVPSKLVVVSEGVVIAQPSKVEMEIGGGAEERGLDVHPWTEKELREIKGLLEGGNRGCTVMRRLRVTGRQWQCG